MSIAYFDAFAGIAGDMILGAMLDAGLPLKHLQRSLQALRLRGYRLERRTERRNGLGGTKLYVRIAAAADHDRSYVEIDQLLRRSRLPRPVTTMARDIFLALARAEARAHRTTVRRVHFHEVGAIDAIVDIVGAAIGVAWFGFDAIHCSPLPMTRTLVTTAHGRWPIPAPATLDLLRGKPVLVSPVQAELVTPTGAAIVTTVAAAFGSNPLRQIKTVGYGLGDRSYREVPNALRLMIGDGERLIAVEANIDDMNPECYEYLIEQILAAGALDVTLRPVLMKKRRPGAQLQVLCDEDLRAKVSAVILRESTSFGVRFYPVARQTLRRELRRVATKFGAVPVKLGWLGDELFQISPEYEACKQVARRRRVPLKEVYRVAAAAVK